MTDLYRNNLKNREFGKEASQNFQAKAVRSERPLPNGQGASEHENFEKKPTLPKTDSSGCFGIRISTPQIEGSLQVSKQLKFQVLLDDSEMKSLLQDLSPVHICVVSEPTPLDRALIPTDEFLEKYSGYVAGIKEGNLIDEKPLRRYFSSAWTSDLDTAYAMAVSSEKYLVKPIKPLIQLQGHHFFYSDLDKQFHPMVLSQESVTWGIQFSYPQLSQDPKTSDIIKVGKGEDFPNTALFAALTKWLREHTLPTPFVVDGIRTNAPIRLGKQCLNWIGKHPQLVQKGIEVFSFSASN